LKVTKYLERPARWLCHPLMKRIGLAALINASIGLTFTWFSYEQSDFVGLLKALVSVVAAEFMLCSSDTRKARWEQAKSLARENRGSAVCIGALLALMGLAYSNLQTPEEPFVLQVRTMVEVFGLLPVIMVPAFRDVLFTVSTGAFHTISSVVNRLVWGMTAYTLALWLIGAAGDEVYRWATTNPNETMVMATSFVICWGILFVGSGHAATPPIARGGMSAAGVPMVLRKPTARDNLYTAAHEAGHALVYAALGGLPRDLKLVVNERADEEGTLGFVTGISSAHHLEEKTFAEWYMLVFLAGKFGEAAMHGESTLGSSSDHLRWIRAARNYLSNHYRGMFYTEPQNKLEQEQNDVKLEALQIEQLEALRKFFDLNIEVFKSLTDTLLEKRSMDRDDLIPFLSRVNLPDGFPLPFGPFKQFGENSPSL